MSLRARLRAALSQDQAQVHELLLNDGFPVLPQPLKPAAVLIPVTDRAEPGLILTQRSASLRAHAGQIAFPGGRIDATDADAVAAALREAREEIALPPDAVEVLGQADLFRTGTGFEIQPIVGIVPPDLPLHPSESEVDAVFEVPLDFVLHPANRARRSLTYQGAERHYYEILWGERRIWGITAQMIVNLAWRLGDESARPRPTVTPLPGVREALGE